MLLYYVWDRFLRPFPELDEEGIEELLREICVSFANSFQASFKDVLLQQRLAESCVKKCDDSNDSLLEAPERSYIIKVGYIWKRGAKMKSWKRRYFRAMNESDNYNVVYADDECAAKPIGTINLCGYRVEEFSTEEAQLYGQYGIKLRPIADNTKRVWWLRAESDSERLEWEEVLTVACSRAKPPRESDSVIAAAFHQSFKHLRHLYGYTGHINTAQLTEIQLLVDLTHSILVRELLADYYASLPNTVYREGFVSDTEKHIQELVLNAVESLWQNCVNHKQEYISAIDGVSEQELDLIRQTDVLISQELHKSLHTIVHPVMCDLLSRDCIPLMLAITEPINDIFHTAVKEFHALLKQCILLNYVQHDNKSVDQSCSILYRQIDNESSGALTITRQKLWEMYTTKLDDSMFPGDFSIFDFYELVKGGVFSLLSDAVYTFIHEANQSSSKDKHKLTRENREAVATPQLHIILSVVMTKLVHDVEIRRRDMLMSVLRRLISATAEEMIYEPCSDDIKALQALVPSTVSSVFNLPIHGERVVGKMIDEYLSSLVDEATLDVATMSQFDEI